MIFNLIYHICPFKKTDIWQKNLDQLKRRLHLFNGKRIITVATDKTTEDAKTVCKYLEPTPRLDIRVIKNDPQKREAASFIPMIKEVCSTSHHEATFYAHAKGVATIGDATGVMFWRNLMYHKLLDFPEKIERLLLGNFDCVGTHRIKDHAVYPDRKLESKWHFSGTFFWFRHDAIFTRKDWADLADSGWAVEAYLAHRIPIHRSSCQAMENPVNPYDPATYAEEDRIEDFGGAGVSSALKVELGGGKFPKGKGFVNVDRDFGDVLFDFETLAKGKKLPFEDDSVLNLYTSHCIEHIRALKELMREIVRICRVGAIVEIRIPAWNSAMAMCYDHKHVIPPEQMKHWTETACEYWFGGLGKKLKLFQTNTVPGGSFERWKRMLPNASDKDIMELCPDAAHETQWICHVVEAPELK